MSFYSELQLNQAGSKKLIKECTNKKEKAYHMAVYAFKIFITLAFCFFFVAGFSMIFGNDNSPAGVVVLLMVMVFKNADFSADSKHSVGIMAIMYAVMTICPYVANRLGSVPAFFINIVSVAIMVILGCHNPIMSNQSTIVLGYLLLYGYPVTGDVYKMRVYGMIAGAFITIIVFYRNHRKVSCDTKIHHMISEFNLKTDRSKWQLTLIISIPLAMLITELLGFNRSMWAGIAVMSVIAPQISGKKMRMRLRIIGNIFGGALFFVLYKFLPAGLYANIGLLGGLGVGLSANYGWQAVFNTFGALAIATEAFGLANAISLRIFMTIFAVIFAIVMCTIIEIIFDKMVKKEVAE